LLLHGKSTALPIEEISDWFLVQPIRGARFKCQDCEGIWEGFDFCEKCEKSSAETHPGHTFEKEELEDEYVDEQEIYEEERRRMRRFARREDIRRTGRDDYDMEYEDIDRRERMRRRERIFMPRWR
jgi:hypothetical protein